MNKFILGSILAAISLMAIYGTSASNQVTSWMDGEERPSTQTNFGGPGSTDVALNPDEENLEPFIDVSGRTPLQKAGDIPKRQTAGVASTPNFGTNPSSGATDDTGGVPVTPTPTPETPTGGTSGGATNQAPAQTTQVEEPIRALW